MHEVREVKAMVIGAVAIGTIMAMASAPTHAQTVGKPGDFSFFVAGNDRGSADLGGLSGADARCEALATSVGAGGKQWRAYLSVSASGSGAGIDARDRIGSGPWYNAKGDLIARDIEELHSDRHAIDRHTALNERGERRSNAPHDILTGSDVDGRLALIDGRPATCADWTASGDGIAKIGHDDRMDADSHDNKRFRRWNGSWNSEHGTLGCSAKHLADTGGGGGVYCFAADDGRGHPPRSVLDARTYTFRRGVNVNHWLGDNIAATDDFPAGALYGADWFDEEDVAWIAGQGFDHMRIWVGGNNWVTTTGEVDESDVAHFDRVLEWARKHGLGVVLAMHGLPGYRNGIRYGAAETDVGSPFTDDATRGDAAYLWWLVAKRYVDIGAQLRFELLASPNAESAEQIRLFNAEMIASIRRVDRDRMVYVTSRNMRIEHVADVVFGDANTALVLRMREPEIFTVQFDPRIPRIRFPGTVPDLAAVLGSDAPEAIHSKRVLSIDSFNAYVDEFARKARETAQGREIYIGLSGAIGISDDDSARTYTRAMRSAFERNGLGWAVYDYHTGGAVRADVGKGGPTRILEGLELSKPNLAPAPP